MKGNKATVFVLTAVLAVTWILAAVGRLYRSDAAVRRYAGRLQSDVGKKDFEPSRGSGIVIIGGGARRRCAFFLRLFPVW